MSTGHYGGASMAIPMTVCAGLTALLAPLVFLGLLVPGLMIVGLVALLARRD